MRAVVGQFNLHNNLTVGADRVSFVCELFDLFDLAGPVASQTLFISAKFAMSVIQMLTESSFGLSCRPVRESHQSATGCFWFARPRFCLRAVGNDTGEIDSVAVDHRLAHASA
jgi:hypothetical protein